MIRLTKFSSDGRLWVECDDDSVDICITETDYGYSYTISFNSYDDDYDDYDDDDYDDDYDDSDDSTVMINGRRVYVPSSQR